MTITLWIAWGALVASHAMLWVIVKIQHKTIATHTELFNTTTESIRSLMKTVEHQTSSIRILSRGRPL